MDEISGAANFIEGVTAGAAEFEDGAPKDGKAVAAGEAASLLLAPLALVPPLVPDPDPDEPDPDELGTSDCSSE
jgi:hypothetical protein